MEYVKQGIRVRTGHGRYAHAQRSPQGIAQYPVADGPDCRRDIVDAIVYLTEASQITGEVLHVDALGAQQEHLRQAADTA
jgi:hypothetical protein